MSFVWSNVKYQLFSKILGFLHAIRKIYQTKLYNIGYKNITNIKDINVCKVNVCLSNSIYSFWFYCLKYWMKTNTAELDSSFKQNFDECKILLIELHYKYFLARRKISDFLICSYFQVCHLLLNFDYSDASMIWTWACQGQWWVLFNLSRSRVGIQVD